MARTEIVILNWNTRNYLEMFLPGLLDSCKGLDAEVVVADSHSSDDSLALLEKSFPGVRRIALDDNYGFTGGYNRSLRILGEELKKENNEAEYYILLNSDIEVTPQWLTPLTEWMDKHSECAACGPKLHSWQDRDSFEYAGAAGGYIDALGYPFCRGRVLKKLERDNGQYDSPAPVMWVSGAALCVRRKVWEELEGLDSRYFAHMEEIDFCWRARLAGYEITVIPQSCIFHLGGGTLPQTSPFKLKLNFRNSLFTLRKNLRPTFMARGRSEGMAALSAWLVISARMALDWASAAVYLLTGHKDFASSVFQAHKEYRKECRQSPQTSGKSPAKARLAGIYHGSILAGSLLFGKRIFNHLRKYEDSY